MPTRVPLRFFVVTFAWSWTLWAPFAGASHRGDFAARTG
jgi:hypothetical protein